MQFNINKCMFVHKNILIKNKKKKKREKEREREKLIK